MRGKWRYLKPLILVFILCGIWCTKRYNFHAAPNNGSGLGNLWCLWNSSQPTTGPEREPIIIGHRGQWVELKDGRGGAGNTMRSIERAIDAGVTWIEIDLRKSSDGVLFLFHDADVRRVTNAEQIFLNRKNWAFSSFHSVEIAQLQVDYSGQGARIPCLASVLTTFSGESAVNFILDLKDEGISPNDLRKVAGKLEPHRFVLFGKADCLRQFAVEEREHPNEKLYSLGYTALWTEGSNKYRYLLSDEFFLERCEELGADYLVLPALFLQSDLIARAHAQNRRVLAYGIDEQHPRKVTALEVDGLIVDHASDVMSIYSGS